MDVYLITAYNKKISVVRMEVILFKKLKQCFPQLPSLPILPKAFRNIATLL